MKYLLTLLAIPIFACASCKQTAFSNAVPEQTPTPTIVRERPVEVVVSDIPKGWQPIFQAIDEESRAVGIENLRKAIISDSDIEVRIWAGFGITKLQGFILKRRGTEWSSIHIGIPVGSRDHENKTIPLNTPRSGWESAWDSMLSHGILTLPNAGAIDCNSMYDDGYSYVVEVRKGRNYRTYMYDNPSEKFDNRCAEADKILAIANIVKTDYGVESF
jgi:hypothetical protein